MREGSVLPGGWPFEVVSAWVGDEMPALLAEEAEEAEFVGCSA